MRIIAVILVMMMVISSTGCMTHATVKRAKGEELFWSDAGGGSKPHPGYYCFIPLTVPFDIATSPVQVFFWPLIFPSAPQKHETPAK